MKQLLCTPLVTKAKQENNCAHVSVFKPEMTTFVSAHFLISRWTEPNQAWEML